MKVLIRYFFVKVIYNLLFCIPVFSQGYVEYYNVVNEAEWKLYNDDYESAIELYEEAFRMKEPKAVDHFRMAEALMALGDSMLAFHHLKKANEKGIQIVYNLEKNKLSHLFVRFQTDSIFQSRITELDSIGLIAYFSDLRVQSVVDTINYFRRMDQLYRKQLVQLQRGSSEYLKVRVIAREQDSIVSSQLLNFLVSNPYPDVFIYGEGLYSILFHIHCSSYQKLKTVLYKQLVDGFIPPFHFAPMVDRTGCACEGKMTFKSIDSNCNVEHDSAIKSRISIGLSVYFIDNNLIPNLPRRWLFE